MTKLLRWGATDQWFLEGVLALALLVVAVFGLALPGLAVLGLGDGSTTRAVTLDERATVPDAPSGDGVTLRGTDEGELVFADPDARQRLLLELPPMLAAALALLALVQVLLLARTVRAGDPFAPRNARRLATIALALIAGGVLLPLAFAVTTDLLQDGTPVEELVVFSSEVSALPLLAGLLVAALAEVFRRGTRLRDDTEGLV